MAKTKSKIICLDATISSPQIIQLGTNFSKICLAIVINKSCFDYIIKACNNTNDDIIVLVV